MSERRATVREFAATDRERVIELWTACDLVRPWSDPDLDIDRKTAITDDT